MDKKALHQNEALSELVQSEGWRIWTQEIVGPIVRRLQEKLIEDEFADLETRVSQQKTLKLIQKVIKSAYPGESAHILLEV